MYFKSHRRQRFEPVALCSRYELKLANKEKLFQLYPSGRRPRCRSDLGSD